VCHELLLQVSPFRLCSHTVHSTRRRPVHGSADCPHRSWQRRFYCWVVRSVWISNRYLTHSHSTALFPGPPGWAGARRNLLDFVVQRKITEADTPTIRLGATSSGLISNPPLSSPIFTPDALPAAALPLYCSLGQAPNMLACIRSAYPATDIS